MPFDLSQIRTDLEAVPMHAPMAVELAIAVIDDRFRDAGLAPPGHERWAAWQRQSGKLWGEQIGMLGHLLCSTSLGPATVSALRGRPGDSRFERLTRFFEEIAPLTGEMIRSNQFRQEEAIRLWALTVCGGSIAGETAAQARARTEQLDYRKTLDEFRKADEARKQEAARRRKLLAEARKREADARGWRE